MKSISLSHTLAAILVASVGTLFGHSASARQASEELLGTLPGDRQSEAKGVSADGTVVVGRTPVYNSKVFRWTEDGGMEGLGYLGQGNRAFVRAVSADGSTVIGTSTEIPEGALIPFRWTKATGMQDLRVLLGSETNQVETVSADGTVISGILNLGNGERKAYRWSESDGIRLLEHPQGFSSPWTAAMSPDGKTIVGSGYFAVDARREAFRWRENAGTQPLGLLPGASEAEALAVSSDGTVVAGLSSTPNQTSAFVWTEGKGMVKLDLLPGGLTVEDVWLTADGSTLFGSVWFGRPAGTHIYEPFYWTEAEGVVGLGLPQDLAWATGVGISSDGSVLVAQAGTLGDDWGKPHTWTREAGWQPISTEYPRAIANAISGDGRVIVGYVAKVVDNFWTQLAARWAVTPANRLRLTAPAVDELLVGGTRDTIRWTATGADSVNLWFSTSRSLDVLNEIKTGVPADQGYFVWTVPDTLTRFASIIIEDPYAVEVTDTLSFFRIKTHHLARTGADGDFEGFSPARHGWNFSNSKGVLDPPSYANPDPFVYTRIPFAGTDPFSALAYDSDDFAGLGIGESSFPDYPSTVRAFGTEPFYWIDPRLGIYKDSGLLFWSSKIAGTKWAGSCSGLSISALMAFAEKDAFGAAFPAIGSVDRLNAVVPALPVPDPVRNVINQLFVYWKGQVAQTHAAQHINEKPRQTLARLKEMLLDPNESFASAGYLYISNLPPSQLPARAHAVLPFRLRRGAEEGKWNLDIYDPNAPNKTRIIRIDSTANTWSYPPYYDGSGRFALMDPHTNYYGRATLPSGASKVDWNTGVTTSDRLEVFPPAFARVRIEGQAGAVGYADSLVFHTLEDASYDLVPTGYPSSPASYTLPDGAYAVTLGDYPDPDATFNFSRHGVSYTLVRTDAAPEDTDRLTIGEGLTYRSEQAGQKTVMLRSLAAGTTQDRSFLATGLVVQAGDSVSFRHEPGDVLVIENGPTAKTYDLRIQRSGPDTVMTITHASIVLGGGHRHQVAPNWAAPGEPAKIRIDADGDGVWEDSLLTSGTITAIERDEDRATGRTAAFGLEPGYPNPFRGATTIGYRLAEASDVRLTVLDLLGREVRVLESGRRAAGRHESRFEAGDLPPGVYLYRLDAGAMTQTRSLVLVR